MAGAFLIVPSHVGSERTWSMISHSAEKERMGEGIEVREGKVREGAASFSVVHPPGQDQGTRT
jgi:hypothetical protein